MNILLTGGAGYIGSHTTVSLLEAGHEVIVVDNFSNSSPVGLKRVEQITGKKVMLYEANVSDRDAVRSVMENHRFDCVIHFAGLKAVDESVKKPIDYYCNNIDTTLTLLECMEEFGIKNIVFSSSATVYGNSSNMPCVEKMGRGHCTNPYGWTKYMVEQILEDAAVAYRDMSVVLLRYFNPIGAHESGLIGEDPRGVPNNLMPYVSQVAVGTRNRLTIYGDDYNTPDGTCRRDYIHVMDLADGHVKAVEYAVNHTGVETFNLGTGKPYSVLELVKTFENVNNVKIKYVIGPRRAGDLPDVWSDPSKALNVLGWQTKRTLEDMCRDAWNWQQKNPKGYTR